MEALKILVSTKNLASALNELRLKTWAPVQRIIASGNVITFITQKKDVNLKVDILEFKPMVVQDGRNWDEIKKIVNRIPDQLITLYISPRTLLLIVTA